MPDLAGPSTFSLTAWRWSATEHVSYDVGEVGYVNLGITIDRAGYRRYDRRPAAEHEAYQVGQVGDIWFGAITVKIPADKGQVIETVRITLIR